MKKAFAVVFWLFSAALALMALALLSASVLSGTLLLCCAVLINPVFIEKIQLKKGLTALLAIGLFIASIAVFPSDNSSAAQSLAEENPVARAGLAEAEGTLPAPEETASGVTRGLQPIEETQEPNATIQITPTMIPNATPTQNPTPTLTQTPNPTPTPTKTPKPTPTSAPMTRSVGITIVDYSASVRRGAYAFIEILGAPNTDYTCDVEYKSGNSDAAGLGTKRSDANGKVSWRWKVGPRTSLNYIPTIYIDGGGDSISVDFEVTG